MQIADFPSPIPPAGGAPAHGPAAERPVTTNLWAFLLWLAATRGVALTGWAALCGWAAAAPEAFAAAMADFAGPAGAGLESRLLAAWLLHADLRPGDRLLLAARLAAAEREGVSRFVTLHVEEAVEAAALWQSVAAARASVLVLPSGLLDQAAMRQPDRADLSALRLILVLGGPPGAALRRRVGVWVRPDLVLVARRGRRCWGSPLDPAPDADPWPAECLP